MFDPDNKKNRVQLINTMSQNQSANPAPTSKPQWLKDLAATRKAITASNTVPEPEIQTASKDIPVLMIPEVGVGEARLMSPKRVKDLKIALINALLAEPPQATGDKSLIWLASIVCNLSAGFLDVLAVTRTQVNLVPIYVTPYLVAALDGTIAHDHKSIDPNGRTEAPAEIEEEDEGKWFGLIGLEELHPDLDKGGIRTQYTSTRSSWDTLTAVAIMLFGIAKPANVVNYKGFTENRTRAIANFLGAAKIEGGTLSPGMFPTLKTLEIVKGTVAVHHSFRVALCTELVKWAEATRPDPVQRVVGLVIQLWKGTGMTHVGLIHSLIEGYSEAIMSIPILEAEAARFAAEAIAVANDRDCFHPYCKAINGDKDKTLQSQKFPELFKLAVFLARHQSGTMANYSTSTPVSTFHAAFEEACFMLGLVLPGSTYNPTAKDD